MTELPAASTTTEHQQSILTLVIGKSGRGKSTSIRNLPPEDTYVINCVGKPFPFAGGIRYKTTENMTIERDAVRITQHMTKISDAGFKHLVIDDTQYIMASEFMSKAMERGYDKYSIMARNIWNILILATTLRPGLKVYILTHEEDSGNERKMKTLGKLLEEKICPEGISAIVLFAETMLKENNLREYFFTTQTDGVTTAKSPMGMFPFKIPNDLKLVSDRIDEYYQGVKLKDSKISFNIGVVS
jgi:hypothetical protein